MNAIACYTFLSLVLCLTSALDIEKHAVGQKRNHGNLGIINGKKASIRKFPYMVSIITEGTLQGSGVILNSNWILTTAFNVAWSPMDEIELRVGSNAYKEGGQTLTAEKVVVHENYSGWDYDIAVVKVSKPIKLGKKAKPIKLGTKEVKAKTKVVASGWGSASEYGDPSPILLSGELTVMDRNVCHEMCPHDLTDRLMCTFDTTVAPCGVSLLIEGSLQGSGVILNSYRVLTTAFNVAWAPSEDIKFRARNNSVQQL